MRKIIFRKIINERESKYKSSPDFTPTMQSTKSIYTYNFKYWNTYNIYGIFCEEKLIVSE